MSSDLAWLSWWSLFPPRSDFPTLAGSANLKNIVTWKHRIKFPWSSGLSRQPCASSFLLSDTVPPETPAEMIPSIRKNRILDHVNNWKKNGKILNFRRKKRNNSPERDFISKHGWFTWIWVFTNIFLQNHLFFHLVSSLSLFIPSRSLSSFSLSLSLSVPVSVCCGGRGVRVRCGVVWHLWKPPCFKTSPCAPAQRPQMVTLAWCRYTLWRFERAHGEKSGVERVEVEISVTHQHQHQHTHTHTHTLHSNNTHNAQSTTQSTQSVIAMLTKICPREVAIWPQRFTERNPWILHIFPTIASSDSRSLWIHMADLPALALPCINVPKSWKTTTTWFKFQLPGDLWGRNRPNKPKTLVFPGDTSETTIRNMDTRVPICTTLWYLRWLKSIAPPT